jgi:hypothetical protein
MGGGGVSIRCDEDDGDDSVSVGQGGSLARRKRDQEGAWAHSPFVLGPGPSLLPIPSPQMTIRPLISPFPPLPLILLEQVIERQPVGDEVGKEVKEVDGAEGDPIPEPEEGGKGGSVPLFPHIAATIVHASISSTDKVDGMPTLPSLLSSPLTKSSPPLGRQLPRHGRTRRQERRNPRRCCGL